MARAAAASRAGARCGAWLYRIATNACLDAIARRPKRVLPIDYGPPADARRRTRASRSSQSVWVEPYPDELLGVEDGYAAPEARYEQREAVELAFIAALQHLPPRQRAALILREVLGFSAREVAEALDTTVASVNSALQRARKTVDERLPERSQQATLRSLGDERVRDIVERFIDAFERGDVDAILGDAGRGRDVRDAAVSELVPRPRRDRRLVAHARRAASAPALRPTRANGQLALARLPAGSGNRAAISRSRSTCSPCAARQIADVIGLSRARDVFPRFGLPDELHP